MDEKAFIGKYIPPKSITSLAAQKARSSVIEPGAILSKTQTASARN